jgi:hypothetical protein
LDVPEKEQPEVCAALALSHLQRQQAARPRKIARQIVFVARRDTLALVKSSAADAKICSAETNLRFGCTPPVPRLLIVTVIT